MSFSYHTLVLERSIVFSLALLCASAIAGFYLERKFRREVRNDAGWSHSAAISGLCGRSYNHKRYGTVEEVFPGIWHAHNLELGIWPTGVPSLGEGMKWLEVAYHSYQEMLATAR